MNDMDFSTSVEIDALEVKIEHLVGIGQRNNRLHAHSKHVGAVLHLCIYVS